MILRLWRARLDSARLEEYGASRGRVRRGGQDKLFPHLDSGRGSAQYRRVPSGLVSALVSELGMYAGGRWIRTEHYPSEPRHNRAILLLARNVNPRSLRDAREPSISMILDTYSHAVPNMQLPPDILWVSGIISSREHPGRRAAPTRDRCGALRSTGQ
jgi:hypothetical protein